MESGILNSSDQTFSKQTILHAIGPGWFGGGTWPVCIRPLLSLPIDHAFANDRVVCERFQVGPNLASDQLPIWLDLRIGPRQATLDMGKDGPQ